MIKQETATRIYGAYREIAASEKLLADMEKAEKSARFDRHEPHIKDAFGRRQQLQLGVPQGDSGHRILGVAPDLAKSIIRAHMANKRSELVEANEQARIELDEEASPVPEPVEDEGPF